MADVTVGSGSDSILLTMSEDQAVGVDAGFTVNVDGQQIGGVQSATASHAAGQTQTFEFRGNYDPGPHAVTVTFTNNFLMPEDRAGADRNLYIDGISYNGEVVSDSTTALYQSPQSPPNEVTDLIPGNAVFQVNDTTAG